MKHATPAALQNITALLQALRVLPGLVERKPGIFYVKGQAYLHFHEDPAGLFADGKLDGTSFERYALNSEDERRIFLDRVRQHRLA